MNRALLVLVLTLLTCGGCAGAGLGTIGDVLAEMGGMPGYGTQVRGEIDRMDTRSRRIDVRADNGRRERLLYDSRTDVVRGNERMSASRLRTGDRITARVERDRGGDLYAHQIYLEYDDRNNGSVGRGRVDRFNGQVSWIDLRSDQFEMVAGRERVTVQLSNRANRATADRFRRLRTGNRVRIEGEWITDTRVQLIRFL